MASVSAQASRVRRAVSTIRHGDCSDVRIDAPADGQVSDVSCCEPGDNEERESCIAGLLTSDVFEHLGELLRRVSNAK